MSAAEVDGVAVPAPRGKRALNCLLATPLLGAAVAIFTWPIYSIRPTAGPDPSWLAGLYMAAGNGLLFGKQFIFTYGPLGFLQEPVLYGDSLWMISFAYRGLVHIALAISLLWVARRALPLAVAFFACYALLVVGYLAGETVLLVFIWCLVVLEEGQPRLAPALVVFVGGSISAIELLGKANFGIAAFAFCAIALLGIANRRRNLPRFAGVLLAAISILWLLSGQTLSNIGDFASNALEAISGYSQAMGIDLGTFSWELPFAIAAMTLLLASTALATRRQPLPRRLASLLLVALFAFLAFKQGFVRQGPGSRAQFFVLMLGGGIAIASRFPARLARLPPRLPALALVLPLAGLAIFALPGPSFLESLEPSVHTAYLSEDLRAFLSPSERNRIRSEGTASMRASYRLDRRTLRLIGDRPVQVDPWEIGVAWAYRLNWHPLPVIQDYLAYTPRLDRLNADALSGAGGPTTILRQNASAAIPTVDDRYPGWDPPAAMLAMLCHFRAVHTTDRWQVLYRVHNRCGPPRPIGTVHSQTGKEIAIPPSPNARDIVFARIHGVGLTGWEGLLSFLYRAPDRTVTFDGQVGQAGWRVVPSTAEDGLIVRAPGAVDYPEPFRLAPDARAFSVRVAGATSRPVRIEFFAQKVGR